MAKGGIATVLTVLAAATLPRLEHPAKNDGSLSLLVVRDWGRKGECNPFRIAQQDWFGYMVVSALDMAFTLSSLGLPHSSSY
ncbi:unnamed protein product [Miscanthus lutarioriparius]|uniref:CASP-like protein n=1 Tax=Miscanthus lutarioriparius TaxID=422564 RepID=A0A811Q9Y8_9POAL|nr:unnamed protein product [Miscanthus lutarioriparius]